MKYFSYLKKLDNELIFEHLINEHPQIQVLILCNIKSKKAADILNLYPADKAADILVRISKTDSVKLNTIKDISDEFQLNFEDNNCVNINKNIISEVKNVDVNLAKVLKD